MEAMTPVYQTYCLPQFKTLIGNVLIFVKEKNALNHLDKLSKETRFPVEESATTEMISGTIDRTVRPIEHYLDASIVTNGLSRAFSTGAWSHPYKKMERISGVVANLGLANPLQTMVDLRKTHIHLIGEKFGENCELVKNLATTALVSTNVVEPIVDKLFGSGMEKVDSDTSSSVDGKDKVFLNGEWVGVCEDSLSFATELRRNRRRKELPFQGKENYTFQSLLDQGIVELIAAEDEACRTAWDIKYLFADVEEKQPVMYTHCELDMSFLLSLSCGIIPFANHYHSRRVLYQAQKHSQQAIGFSTINPNIGVDTLSHRMYYPQTMTADGLGKSGYPLGQNRMQPKPELYNGQNAIVAVDVHLGYNQEDSLVMNGASTERGMFRTEHVRSYKAEVENTEIQERWQKPEDISGDIVIGRFAESGADHGVKLKHSERGMVQKVVLSSNDDGKNFAVVSPRQVRSPCLGDKFSSMHGQKGVLGFLESQENFPFTTQGIVPDIGIACGGSMKFATPFSTLSMDVITEQFHRAGFSRWGNERVYNGRTGEMVHSLIFMGPTFYQRLVHMSEDKVKFRNTGPVHPLTRQPVADRKRYGGIKFGEMECDCLIAHGASANLHERLFTLSDSSGQMHVCQNCKNTVNVTERTVDAGRKIRGPNRRVCLSRDGIVRMEDDNEELGESKPLLVKFGFAAVALSFAGFLCSRFKTLNRVSDGRGEIDSGENDRSRGGIRALKPTPTSDHEEVLKQQSFDSGSIRQDGDVFFLTQFDGLVDEFDFSDVVGSSPKQEVGTPRSELDTWRTFRTVEKDGYEQEIEHLRNTVRVLREKMQNLEVQLLEYYGLKEQETAVSELRNRLEINNMEAKLFRLKIESLQSEKQQLEGQVANHAKAVAELESARSKIKVLEEKLQHEAEMNKEQILNLQKRVSRLQEQELKAPANNPDIESKFQRLEAWNRKAIDETSNRLRQENEDLIKQIEQLKSNRCNDVEELVYLRWVNSCLRYELRNYRPPTGEIVARDLCQSLSPKSEAKAKKLVHEYAHTEGMGHNGMDSMDFDFDRWSSSLASETRELDDSSMENSSATKSTNSGKKKFFKNLRRLIRRKGSHPSNQASSTSKTDDPYVDGPSAWSSSMMLRSRSERVATPSQSSSGTPSDVSRWRSLDDEPIKDVENIRSELSSYGYKRFILGNDDDDDGSSFPLESEHKDSNSQWKSESVKLAEVFEGIRMISYISILSEILSIPDRSIGVLNWEGRLGIALQAALGGSRVSTIIASTPDTLIQSKFDVVEQRRRKHCGSTVERRFRDKFCMEINRSGNGLLSPASAKRPTMNYIVTGLSECLLAGISRTRRLRI
ncbi:DNA-directed RNA polymerase D subunit 2b [Hibiscus syriacus]|uniref:DNA-directed RNA polymerase n=1 Tax=Hibiscus syriacus TaxID=106335 RepID=A0A6A2ZE09_HIBSY|nr:DNA-directed RNA polymerase D subunit 2b [Hibiscus syriacus]